MIVEFFHKVFSSIILLFTKMCTKFFWAWVLRQFRARDIGHLHRLLLLEFLDRQLASTLLLWRGFVLTLRPFSVEEPAKMSQPFEQQVLLEDSLPLEVEEGQGWSSGLSTVLSCARE